MIGIDIESRWFVPALHVYKMVLCESNGIIRLYLRGLFIRHWTPILKIVTLEDMGKNAVLCCFNKIYPVPNHD